MNDDAGMSLPPGVRLALRLRGGGRVSHAAWAPDGGSLAAGLDDGKVRLWTGLPVRLRQTKAAPASRDFQALEGAVSQLAWSPGGRSLAAVADFDKRIAVWGMKGLRRRSLIDVDAEALICAGWAREGRLNAAVIKGKNPRQRLAFRTYEAASGEPVGEREDAVRDAVFTAVSADGRLLAVAGREGGIQVWDVSKASVVADVRGPHRDLHGVALTPDGGALIVSLDAGELQVYDPRGARREVMREHSQPAYSVVCSDDGRLLATKSADNTVRLWRCDTWECVASIEEAGGEPVELAFRPGTLDLTCFDANNTALLVLEIDYEEIVRGGPMITILMLKADPFDGSRLRLEEEEREIKEQLQLAGLRSRFNFQSRGSVRPKDFSRGLLEVRPRILHFSGHGGNDGSVWLEDEIGQSHPVAPKHLAALMEQVSDYVDCVVLNACYSRKQADAISQSIDYVVGTKSVIGDRAAIAFSVGFYQALGEGHSIEESFKLGRAQVGIRCGDEYADVPVLRKKGQPRPKRKPARATARRG